MTRSRTTFWPGSAPTAHAPQPAGERCEMCSEPIADEHQHVVNVEGRQLMCVCRGCYLLFTDTNAAAALPRGARPVPVVSRTSRSTAASGKLLQIPVGLAFFFRNSALGPHRRVLSGPGGRNRIRTGSGRLERSFAAPTRGWTCWPTTSRRCWCGCPKTRQQPPVCLSGADRRLLRVRRPPADAVARLRRRPAGRASSSTSSSITARAMPQHRRCTTDDRRRDVRGPRRRARTLRGHARC